jgi:hypothetical protein
MAEPTVQQRPMGHRLGLLVRAVPRFRRRARAGAGPVEADSAEVPHGVLSLRLDLAVADADDAAAALERILDVLQPGDRLYLVGRPGTAEPRVDDRPFTIWA